MAKFYGFVLVVLFAVIIAMGFLFGNSLGHSAGTVLQDWNQRQETTATKTPPPLTTIMFGGDN